MSVSIVEALGGVEVPADLPADAVLWARERRLAAVAERLGIVHPSA